MDLVTLMYVGNFWKRNGKCLLGGGTCRLQLLALRWYQNQKKSSIVVEFVDRGSFNSKSRGNSWNDRTVSFSRHCSGNCLQECFSELYDWPEEVIVFFKQAVFNLSVKIALKMSLSNMWDAEVSLVLYRFCSAVGVYIEALHHGGVRVPVRWWCWHVDVSGEIRGAVGTSLS